MKNLYIEHWTDECNRNGGHGGKDDVCIDVKAKVDGVSIVVAELAVLYCNGRPKVRLTTHHQYEVQG